MEEITEKEAKKITKEEKEKIKQIMDEGGKTINCITYEKDKITTTRKIEPVNGKDTSSTIIQTKDRINISF